MFSRKSYSSKLILPILLILLLSIAGCASKAKTPENLKEGTTTPGTATPAPSNSQNTKPGSTTATGAGVITYENYLKIKLDMSYDDVKSILGEGKKKEIKTDIISYTWEEQGKTILVQTNKGKVQTKIQSKLGKTTSKLTVDQFDKITNDMTIDQLVSILGPDYAEVSYKKSDNAILRNVIWALPDRTSIKVYLKDGKVINKNNDLKK